jgi:hypothetical protein
MPFLTCYEAAFFHGLIEADILQFTYFLFAPDELFIFALCFPLAISCQFTYILSISKTKCLPFCPNGWAQGGER